MFRVYKTVLNRWKKYILHVHKTISVEKMFVFIAVGKRYCIVTVREKCYE